MKGDFSRTTFDRTKHFTRVLMQQGRVQLDADWNEQMAVLLHYLQTLAKDLIGEHGGPGDSFKVVQRSAARGKAIARDFSILPGHYYVHGILCENEGPSPLAYTSQPGYPFPDSAKLEADGEYLVYLDVWERHITYIEDDSIREVALDGPDTATRAKVVWQVKAVPVELDELDTRSEKWIEELRHALANLKEKLAVAEQAGDGEAVKEIKAKMDEILDDIARRSGTGEPVDVKTCDTLPNKKLSKLSKLGEVRLRARARLEETPQDACITPPEARYRGAENQLYRVEIHADSTAKPPTFKWSRDNGSVVFPIRTLQGSEATLEHLGRDDRRSLKVGDWVGIADDDYVLRGEPGPLLQVDAIDPVRMTVSLKLRDGINLPDYDENSTKHPLLRRWDHRAGDPTKGEAELVDDGALLVNEDEWVILEDGVQIQFQEPDEGQPENEYRTGDYWLIPARTATADVEWPQERDEQGNLKKDEKGNLIPEALLPHGIEHHYAPLAIISVISNEPAKVVHDCRYHF